MGWKGARLGARARRPHVPDPLFLSLPPQPDPATTLPRQAAVRGAYTNTGSRDAGPDPDWRPPS